MEVQPLGDDKWRVFLQTSEFLQMIDSAKHQRARLAMWLMALSLRVKTTANLVVGQFYQDNEGVWWLHVEAKDATDRDRATKPREVHVPQEIIEKIESYLGDDLASLPDTKPVFDEVKRTLQRDVEDARENAAIATGIEDYLKVSSHDFRRYFASHYMFRLGVDPHATRQMGGWKCIEHMVEYLLLPRDLVKNRLADAAVLGENPLTIDRSGATERVESNFDTIEYMLFKSDDEELTEILQDRLATLGEQVDGIKVVRTDRSYGQADSTESTHDGTKQSSFQTGFGSDDIGRISLGPAVKVAYCMVLIAGAWIATLAPIL